MKAFALALAGFLFPFVSSEVETPFSNGSPVARLSTSLEMNGGVGHPEAKPFGHPDRARHDIAAALSRASTNGHRIVLVFGANWCHDSRALAGWFATPRFRDMLAARYEIVWVDVGNKDKNLDVARRFGLDGIKGTPAVLILDASGKPSNLADAQGWRNASTRTSDAIFDYFAKR